MKFKTPRMIVEEGIAEAERVEQTAPEMADELYKSLKIKFPTSLEIIRWFYSSYDEIKKYIDGEYWQTGDEIKDTSQKKTCMTALIWIKDQLDAGYFEKNPDYGFWQRFDRMMTAIYILAIFIPGRHLGFTVWGATYVSYLKSAFGGDTVSCGRFGFGIRILRYTPPELKMYIRDILGETA